MKLPQSVYDVILSYWSAVKTIDERDYLHVNWFVMREMSCCCIARQRTFMKAWKTLLPEWYDAFDKKTEINYEIKQYDKRKLYGKLQASRDSIGHM